jgi:hypothetical protein
MHWGSNKYGQKKIYKLERFLEYKKKIYLGALIVIGFNLSYLLLSIYYKKLDHDTWVTSSYGDYVPTYEKLGHFTFRTQIRKIPYYFHSWKLVSTYNFSKYDVATVQFNTGIPYQFALAYIARQNEYKRKRDPVFDFMQIGEDDFKYYTDYMA